MIDRWPPRRQTSYCANLKHFMEKFNVMDIWRDKFPGDKIFTWSNKTGSRQSHIDFWLISNSINEDNIAVNILATPFKDHRAIHISIQIYAPDNTPYKCSN
ncbi:hypothetical protein XENORESO_021423 [Xenotaenia resolanae]|uniref:Endonuclease/exonuclease/phosphatase domain-containing protein n=1 Tax=Xenotaenia resolanae TaxID=208358 RepID=A0ABV0X791_9TELE